MMKLLLLLVASAAVFSQSAASTTTRALGDASAVVDAIRSLLQALEGGLTGTNLRGVLNAIEPVIDPILEELNAQNNENAVQAILNSVNQGLYVQFGIDPTINEFTRAMGVLSGLADALEGALGSNDQDNAINVLLAIKVTAATIVGIVNENGDQQVYAYVPDTPATRAVRAFSDASQRRRRGGCIGICWGKREITETLRVAEANQRRRRGGCIGVCWGK